jgi:hypothetical protein
VTRPIAGGQVQHRVRHPGERGGVQRHPLGRRDLLGRHAALDGQGPGGQRPRLGGAGQRLGQPQPDQGDLLRSPADVQPDAERPGQQRLQRRDVQDRRAAPGRTTSAHAQQRYLPRPGDHPETPEPA